MKIILFLVRLIHSLRYRVKISWEENLEHSWPLLILPNHVALVDPRILISFLGKYVSVSPVASEKYYNKPGMRQIMNLVWTVPIWEMSAWAKKEDVEKVFAQVVKELWNWKNILIYPSGQIYRQWFESIKWKQSVYNITKLMPENTKVIWIRDRGLWGSMWSMAWDNGKTWFGMLYLKSVWYVLANFIFFVPKREVTLEIEDITAQIQNYKNMSLNEMNWFLESFYNKQSPHSVSPNGREVEQYVEDINYIPHYFYYNDVKNRVEPEMIDGSLAELNATKNHDLSKIDDTIKNEIISKIWEIKEISSKNILEDSNLVIDLFLDSLDLAEIKSFVQANFEWASNPPIGDLKTVWDLIIMAVGQSENVEDMKKCEWKVFWKSEDLRETINTEIKTIPQLWKQNFKNNKLDDFVWDNILWLQTKRDFTIKAYFIAGRLKKIEWKYIGIMLPAVWGASLLIMATYLAGKIPVMFNWTLSKDAFNHCVDFSKVNKIISVSSFYNRVKTDFLEEHNSQWKFIFLEDLLKNWKTTEKVAAFVKSLYMPVGYKYICTLQDTAVILFTSGSESLPKAVPLTHQNLIENISWAIDIFKIQQDDILLGFLPPFHSFGFTVNTIMPLITWVRVAYTPDPNDAKTIIEVIKNAKITSLTATPTFLKMIMNLANWPDLETLKYSVVWAEKCPQVVFDRFKELCPNWKILEWYWITECSPVVAINPIGWAKPWTVWKIISCLDCKIMKVGGESIRSLQECEVWEQWMIYVKWNSIFKWYLDDKIESPFEDIMGNEKVGSAGLQTLQSESNQYYKTWDLWFLDSDWFLSITWRLKRFIKIAWEMISLPALEETIARKYNTWEELEVAIEALEKDGEAKIVLFSIEHIEIEEVNDYMRKNGVPNLVKISEVIKIEEIPVLGTGKTDYKELKKLIEM